MPSQSSSALTAIMTCPRIRTKNLRTSAIRAGLCVALAAALSFQAQAAPASMETSAPAPEAAYHPGRFIFAQLTTPDLAKAKAFYGPLLGWTFRDQNVSKGHYSEAFVGDHVVAGLVERPLPDGDNPPRPLWLPFISGTNVRSVADSARHYGAHMLFSPRSIPGRGEQAILIDPQGAVFAILRRPKSDGSDAVTTTQGDWIWNALVSPAPTDSAGFYQSIFGYQVQAAPSPDTTQRFILTSQTVARASINPLPPRLPAGAAARWISFVQVDNVGATAEKAVQLGGSVVVEPHLDHQNCMIALIADPSGGVFGIMEWHDPAPEYMQDGEAK